MKLEQLRAVIREVIKEEASQKELMSRHPGLKDLHDKVEMMRVS